MGAGEQIAVRVGDEAGGYMDSFVAACFIPHTDSNLFPSSVQEG